jgi:mono/diheme cytochrome c family protein
VPRHPETLKRHVPGRSVIAGGLKKGPARVPERDRSGVISGERHPDPSLDRPLFAALLLAATTACGASTSTLTALTGDATTGQSVYGAQCASCHGADGASGSARRPTPSVARSDAAAAASTIVSGEDEMPAFASTLSDQEIADVIAYLKTL